MALKMHLGIPLGDIMADIEFDLGEAMGGYEQARADRDFYLSMMQQGNQNRGAFMASPIAAYLAGVSGVKLANMRTKVQQVEDAKQAKADAIAATERAQKRFDNLQDNMFKIASAANKGDLSQGAAAAMFGHIVREAGGTPISYDADNGILSYNLKGEDYEVDLKESPTSRGQRELQKLYLQESRDRRAEQAAKDKAAKDALDIELKQLRVNSLRTGNASKGSSQKERDFFANTKEWYESVWNPKGQLKKGQSLYERVEKYVGNDRDKYNAWMNRVSELPEEAQAQLQPFTDIVARYGSAKFSDVGPVLTSGESKSGTSALDIFF